MESLGPSQGDSKVIAVESKRRIWRSGLDKCGRKSHGGWSGRKHLELEKL